MAIEMNFLCRIGIHRPLSAHYFYFTDVVSGKPVYIAVCPCGKDWLVDSERPYLGSKVRRVKKNDPRVASKGELSRSTETVIPTGSRYIH